MTVTNPQRLVIYTGNGATTDWPFSFAVPAEENLEVYVREVASQDLTLIPPAEYQVIDTELAETFFTGAVRYPLVGDPLAATHEIIIQRTVPFTQETDVTNQSRFYADVFTRSLDLLAMQIQQLAEVQQRTLKFQPGTANADEPVARLAAGQTLIANDQGTRLIPGPTAGQVASAESYAIAAELAQGLAQEASALAVQAQENLFQAWRGSWTTATEYVAGDLARTGGTTYIALIAHTSGTFNSDLSAGRWAVFAQQGSTGPGTGDLVAVNNLSDLDNPAVAVSNLGLVPLVLPIGSPFPVWTHLDGVSAPSNSGDAKFILLTAGQSGSGQYNNGLVTDEDVSGSFPLVEATAEIATGPLTGEVVHLINTEGSFVRPSGTSGVFQQDAFQGHWHELHWRRRQQSSGGGNTFTDGNADRPPLNNWVREAISDGDNGEPRTAEETRPKSVAAQYFMRIV